MNLGELPGRGASAQNQGVTVRLAVLLTTLPDVAVICVVEVMFTVSAVANPVASIVATLDREEFQLTAVVMSSC